MTNFDKLILFLFNLLGLGLCVSEPLSRNLVRMLFTIFIINIFFKRDLFFYIKQNIIIKYKKIIMLMSAFIIWMVISSIYGGHLLSEENSLTYWFFFSYNMFFFIVIAFFIKNENQLYTILMFIASSLMLDNLYIRLQFSYGILRPDTFLHGSFMQGSIIYIILLPVILTLLLNKNKYLSNMQYTILWCIFVMSIIAFIFMNTRGAWLSLMIVLPFILFYYIRDIKKLLTLALGISILTNIFLITFPGTLNRIETIINFESEQSVTERFLIWQSSINMIKDNPIMGVGLGNYKDKYQNEYIMPEAKEHYQMHAHNTYLHFWAETGLPGLCLFCAIFGYTLHWSWRHRQYVFGMILFSSTLAILLYSMTDYTYASFSAMRVYWVIFGICLKGVDLIETRDNNTWNRDELRRDGCRSA